MKVCELIEALASLPQQAEVVFHHEGHGDVYLPGDVYEVTEADDCVIKGTVVVDMMLEDTTFEDIDGEDDYA